MKYIKYTIKIWEAVNIVFFAANDEQAKQTVNQICNGLMCGHYDLVAEWERKVI